MKWTNDYIAKPFVPLRFHFSLKGALLMAKLSLFIHLSPSLYIHCLSRTWSPWLPSFFCTSSILKDLKTLSRRCDGLLNLLTKWTNDYFAKPFVPLRFHFSFKRALLMAKALFLYIFHLLYIFTAYQELGWWPWLPWFFCTNSILKDLKTLSRRCVGLLNPRDMANLENHFFQLNSTFKI
jgi:hypothetical protein